jgi:hypothetical protein
VLAGYPSISTASRRKTPQAPAGREGYRKKAISRTSLTSALENGASRIIDHGENVLQTHPERVLNMEETNWGTVAPGY